MTIKANHLTLLRLVLIPAPCALLLGGPEEKSLALALFLFIGLTDYLDGHLARRQGPTVLGALLDPIADKMFVVAMFVPLAHEGIVPMWMVWLMLVREIGVTELRAIHESRGLHFETSEMAKYKTSIQMIGGGVIILNHLFGSSLWVMVPMGALLGFGAWLLWYVRMRPKRARMRAVTFLVLVGWATSMRLFFSHSEAILAIMALVCGATLLSGVHYAAKSVKVWSKVERGENLWVIVASLVNLAVVFPAIFLSALGLKVASVWLALAILCSELAIGGMNSLWASSHRHRHYCPPWIRISLVNLLGVAGLLAAQTPFPPMEGSRELFFLGALTLSLSGCARAFYETRRILLEAST
jgi:cardiolipin synthase